MSHDKDIKIVKAENFKLENVKFSDIKTNSKGGKKIYVNYDYEDGQQPKALRIQMPKMKTPFGVSGWLQTRDGKGDTAPTDMSNDTLEFSITDKNILQKLQSLDDMVIKFGEKNHKEIFKKKPSNITEFYKSFLKLNDAPELADKYPPRIKTKLYKNESLEYAISVFNSGNKKKIDKINIYNICEIIPRNCECVVIMSCPGIWIVNNTFGLNFIPSQVVVFKNTLSLPDFAFLEDPDIKKAEEDAVEEAVSVEEAENNHETEQVIDSLDNVSF